MGKKIILFFVLLMAGSLAAQPLAVPASAVKAVVFRVHDGDSFELVDSTRRDSAGYLYRFWIRLYGVDAPEVYAPDYSVNQPFGRDAGFIMRAYLKGETVYCDSVGVDRYDNMVARLYMVDSAGVVTDVGAFAVAQGVACGLCPAGKYARVTGANG